MMQTDIIVYGPNLADYIDCEFGNRNHEPSSTEYQPQTCVTFWRDFL
jgi:hypothetical protein